MYYDGQFDDSRLLSDLCRTADEHGATLLNYGRVTSLSHNDEGYVDGPGVGGTPSRAGRHELRTKCVVNATGAFTDAVRRMDDPGGPTDDRPQARACTWCWRSRSCPADTAIMVPRTSDGRVLFAIPWHNHALVGTTDTPITDVSLEPTALGHEVPTSSSRRPAAIWPVGRAGRTC